MKHKVSESKLIWEVEELIRNIDRNYNPLGLIFGENERTMRKEMRIKVKHGLRNFIITKKQFNELKANSFKYSKTEMVSTPDGIKIVLPKMRMFGYWLKKDQDVRLWVL